MTTPAPHNDNAFDFIRLLAALAVLYSHSYALFGLPLPSPVVGQSWGSLAVAVFFTVSGYLVCSSWERDPNFKRFWIKRAARVLPGLFVAVVFTAFVVGPLMTRHSLSSYLGDAGTWAYLASNATMIVGRFGLPGVFEHNPFANAANASLWTLRYEVLMYLLLSLVGLGMGQKKPGLRHGCLALLLLFVGFWAAGAFFTAPSPQVDFTWGRPLFSPVQTALDAIVLSFDRGELLNFGVFYFSGSLLYLYRHRFSFHVLLALVLAVALALVSDKLWVTPLLWICVPYITLTLAHKLPASVKNACKNDLSYGIYIYAFPVQQVCSYYFLKFNMSWAWSFFTALVATYFLAKFSWHCIELPALGWKSRLLKINHQP